MVTLAAHNFYPQIFVRLTICLHRSKEGHLPVEHVMRFRDPLGALYLRGEVLATSWRGHPQVETIRVVVSGLSLVKIPLASPYPYSKCPCGVTVATLRSGRSPERGTGSNPVGGT